MVLFFNQALANSSGGVWITVPTGNALSLPYGAISVRDDVDTETSRATLDDLAISSQGGTYVVKPDASCERDAVAVLSLDRFDVQDRWEAHDTLVASRQLSIAADHDRVERSQVVRQTSDGQAVATIGSRATARSIDVNLQEKEQAVAGSREVTGTVGWTLTSCDGAVLYVIVEEVTIRCEAIAHTEEQAQQRIDLRSMETIDLPKAVAELHTQKLRGPTMRVERTLYDGGSTALEAAAQRVRGKNPDWNSAAHAWTELAHTPGNERVQGRAFHNLAVYREQLGDLPEAIRMAEQAVALDGSRPTREMLASLKGRLSAQQTLGSK